MAQLLGLETPGEWQTGYIMTLAWGPQVAGVPRFRGCHRLEVRALHPRAERSRDSTTDSPDLEVYVARQARTPTQARRLLFLSTHPHQKEPNSDFGPHNGAQGVHVQRRGERGHRC